MRKRWKVRGREKEREKNGLKQAIRAIHRPSISLFRFITDPHFFSKRPFIPPLSLYLSLSL
jgi:hypothetical protein